MNKTINPDGIYISSPDVVSREIEGQIIIIPIVAGMGDLENELFTLNETGKAIWQKLNGTRTLREIIAELEREYEGPENDISEDVIGLSSELLQQRIIIEKSQD